MTAPDLVPFSGASVAVFVVRAMIASLIEIDDDRGLAPEEARLLRVLQRLQDDELRRAIAEEQPAPAWRAVFTEAQEAGAGIALSPLLPIAGAVPRNAAWRPFPFHLAGLAWAGVTILGDGLRVICHGRERAPWGRHVQLAALLELQGALTNLVELPDRHPRLLKAARRVEYGFAAAAKVIDDDAAIAAIRALNARRGDAAR